MQSSSAPKKLSIPFAESGVKQTIPDVTQIGVSDGRASYPDGFPPLTRTPISAGGVPPYGTDMNGVLFDISNAARWSAAGAHYKYDATFSSSIGGYPKGAILLNASGDGYWQSITENNTTNPDSGGSGWINALGGRLINTQTFYSSGTYTPTAGTKSVIVEMVGGGGGSDAAPATGSGQVSIVSGGGAGAYAKGRFLTGFSGVSVVVGGGGTRGSSGSPTGSIGGTSSFGTLMAAPGGTRGSSAGPANPPFPPQGNTSSNGPTGANIIGSPGAPSTPAYANAMQSFLGSPGASSIFGGGGWVPSFGFPAVSGQGYGAGASGSSQGPSAPLVNGAAGRSGVVIIYEYS